MFCTTDKVDVDIFDIFDQKAKEMDKEKKKSLALKWKTDILKKIIIKSTKLMI